MRKLEWLCEEWELDFSSWEEQKNTDDLHAQSQKEFFDLWAPHWLTQLKDHAARVLCCWTLFFVSPVNLRTVNSSSFVPVSLPSCLDGSWTSLGFWLGSRTSFGSCRMECLSASCRLFFHNFFKGINLVKFKASTHCLFHSLVSMRFLLCFSPGRLRPWRNV